MIDQKSKHMKKYDVVVGVGCSYMNGDAIMSKDGGSWNPHKEGWETKPRPAKSLAKLLNIEEVNIANTGASNERIIRQLYEWVESNNKVKTYENPLILIGLSGLARYSYQNEDTKLFYDLHTASINQYDNSGLENLNKKITNGNGTTKELKDWANYYIRYFFNTEFQSKKLQQNIVMLHYYLKSNGCDYRIHNSIEDNLKSDDYLNTGIPSIKGKINFISFRDKDYKGPDEWRSYLMWQMEHVDGSYYENKELRSNKPPYGLRFCDGHPSPNAGKELAERILKDL